MRQQAVQSCDRIPCVATDHPSGLRGTVLPLGESASSPSGKGAIGEPRSFAYPCIRSERDDAWAECLDRAPIIDLHPAADACMHDTVLNRAN